MNFFTEDPQFSPENPGFPIAYAVRNLGDQDLLRLGYMTDYDAFDCRPYEADLEIRWVGFKVRNAGDGNDGDLYWHVAVDGQNLNQRQSAAALQVRGGQLVSVDSPLSIRRFARSNTSFRITGNFMDADDGLLRGGDDHVGTLDREFTFLSDRWSSGDPVRISVSADGNGLELLFHIRELSHPEKPAGPVANLAILNQPVAGVHRAIIEGPANTAPTPHPIGERPTLPPAEALLGAVADEVNPVPLDPQNGGRSILPAVLRAGDVLVSTTSSPTSWAVRRFTGGGPVSHMRIYAGGEQVIEAVPGQGVVMRPLPEVLAEDTYTVAFRYPGILSGQEQMVVQHAQGKLGQPYDRFAALADARFRFLGRTVYVNLGQSSGSRIYCSTLVLDAFEQAGLRIGDMVSRGRSPNDIILLQPIGSLDYVGHLKYTP